MAAGSAIDRGARRLGGEAQVVTLGDDGDGEPEGPKDGPPEEGGLGAEEEPVSGGGASAGPEGHEEGHREEEEVAQEQEDLALGEAQGPGARTGAPGGGGAG